MSVFNITSADLKAKILPAPGATQFTIAADGDMTEAAAASIIDAAEDMVLGRLPVRDRQLCTGVDGENLVRRARGGETTATLGLFPIVAGTLLLWKNYAGPRGWLDRDPSCALTSPTDYAVNTTTGVVSFVVPLVAGDVIVAEYKHAAGGKLPGLREVALTLAAVEVARRCAFFRSAEGFERFDVWERQALAHLQALASVRQFGDLDLLRDTDPENFYAEANRLLGGVEADRPIIFRTR